MHQWVKSPWLTMIYTLHEALPCGTGAPRIGDARVPRWQKTEIHARNSTRRDSTLARLSGVDHNYTVVVESLTTTDSIAAVFFQLKKSLDITEDQVNISNCECFER